MKAFLKYGNLFELDSLVVSKFINFVPNIYLYTVSKCYITLKIFTDQPIRYIEI